MCYHYITFHLSWVYKVQGIERPKKKPALSLHMANHFDLSLHNCTDPTAEYKMMRLCAASGANESCRTIYFHQLVTQVIHKPRPRPNAGSQPVTTNHNQVHIRTHIWIIRFVHPSLDGTQYSLVMLNSKMRYSHTMIRPCEIVFDLFSSQNVLGAQFPVLCQKCKCLRSISQSSSQSPDACHAGKVKVECKAERDSAVT